MHNIMSRNQLAEWRHIEQEIDDEDLTNDYFNCLIECDEEQSTCKRICRRLLS